jgi:hypothetical protein
MPRTVQIPEDAEVIFDKHAYALARKGGGTVRSLSTEFLLDLQAHWKIHKLKVLDACAAEHPQTYFNGMVALSRIMKWEIGKPGEFDKPRTPEEIMDKLEERVGPEGRKMFERFLRRVRRLEEQQLTMSSADAPLRDGPVGQPLPLRPLRRRIGEG